MEGDGEGGVEEPLAPALHLVAESCDVLQRDLGLGRHGAATAQGEGLCGLEAHLLPLQGARGLLGGYGAEMDGEVHGRARGHESLQESGSEGAGPAAEVQRAGEVPADAYLAPVDRDLHLLVLVPVSR